MVKRINSNLDVMFYPDISPGFEEFLSYFSIEFDSQKDAGREVYLPKNVNSLTDADCAIWNVTEADCIQIYLTNADHPFEEFADYLNNTSGSQKAKDAVEKTTRQHVNKVKLIWQTLDPHLTMFSESKLGDIFPLVSVSWKRNESD